MAMIYLDYQATTPIDPRVLEAMMPYLKEAFGNAASATHAEGWRASAALEKARRQVAQAIGAGEAEVFFTSGATESNNWVFFGLTESLRSSQSSDEARSSPHFITTAIEHKSVLAPLHELERRGSIRLTVLPVDRFGRIDLGQLERAITPHTALVSVIFANNEVGTLQPIAEIGKICKKRSVLFHTDATQALGRVPLDVEAQGIDLLSLSAHKIYGPKGIGALYVRRKNPRVTLAPLLYGGGQESAMRSGTANVAGAVGFGVAAEIACLELSSESDRLRKLRDQMWQALQKEFRGRVVLHGHPTERSPQNLCLSFEGLDAEGLMLDLRGLALSSGSACASSPSGPSHVLTALGVPPEQAYGSLRISLGRFTSEQDAGTATEKIISAVHARLS